MTTKEVATLIESIGLPYAYYQFPEGTGQAPPFICFFFAGSNDMLADDSNYQHINNLVIEFYAANKDFDTESVIETALTNAGLVWSREDTFIDTEKLYETIYETQVVITTGGN